MCPYFSNSSATWPPSKRLYCISSHRLFMNCVAVFHRYARKIVKTYLGSSFSGRFIVTNFSSRGLFWPEQLSFKAGKKGPRGFCLFLPVSGTKKLLPNHYESSNFDCSVQNRTRGLKLVPLEPPKIENF